MLRTLARPAVMGSVFRRPDLWVTAWKSSRSLVPTRWWARRPFLPLPDAAWLRFRLVTAYGGDGSGPVEPDHVIAWLEWQKGVT